MQAFRGQRQRAAIGRTVVKSPDFLLLDETTSSLDAHTAALVQESLKTIMNGRTSVVVSHNMKEIRDADHIIVMNRGRVSGSGTHEELYGTNKIYTTFCDLQNKKRS